MIDDVVTNSNGAYTHDEVFQLQASFVYQLLLRKYEYDCYNERAMKFKNELKQNTG